MSFIQTLTASSVSIGGQVAPPPEPVSLDLYDVQEKLFYGIDTVERGYYFFKAYEAANFSKVSSDKDYFFLYSTDHGNGGLFLGKGNNIDLSDFVEVGQLQVPNYQTETPDLLEINGKLYLYCHTAGTDPGNDNKQQTRLYTYSGTAAQLNLISWTDEGRPYGIVADDNHTGYGKNHYINSSRMVATHIRKGGLPQPWTRSVSTDGGYSFTREADIDTITGIETGYFFKPSEGEYFKFNGVQWWLGTIQPEENQVVGGLDKRMIIAKSNGVDYDSVTQKRIILPDLMLHVHSAKIIGTTAHVYFTKDKDSLWIGKYDLNNLYNY